MDQGWADLRVDAGRMPEENAGSALFIFLMQRLICFSSNKAGVFPVKPKL